MKTQYAMVVDSSLCIDCKGCMVACKVENNVPEGHWRNWIKNDGVDFSLGEIFSRIHYQPGNCMHCDVPTCVYACPTAATYKDETDGVVKVDPRLCIGCSSCIPACPYGARFRHPERKIVDKCDFCDHRRARGELPACVTTCPTKARAFGDINDPESDVANMLKDNDTVRVVNRESDTRPNIYYMGATAPLNWPVKAEAPTPIRWWGDWAKQLVWAVVGINALGVLAMLGKQLFVNDPEPGHDAASDAGGKPAETKETDHE